MNAPTTPPAPDASPAPIIEIDAISKSFGTFQVLNGLSMNVMPGEKLALIGPSGSGKTTILRILMTLESIDDGHIASTVKSSTTCRRTAASCRRARRHLHRMRQKIGMVFQLFNCFRTSPSSTTSRWHRC